MEDAEEHDEEVEGAGEADRLEWGEETLGRAKTPLAGEEREESDPLLVELESEGTGDAERLWAVVRLMAADDAPWWTPSILYRSSTHSETCTNFIGRVMTKVSVLRSG